MFQRILAEQGKGGDKEKNRHAEPADDFQQGDKLRIGGRVEQDQRSGMNGNDAKHGQTADIFHRFDTVVHFGILSFQKYK